MEKEYIVTWKAHPPVSQQHVQCSVVRVFHPPHEEAKGPALRELIRLAIFNEFKYWPSLAIHIYSAAELQNPVWCIGHTREVLVEGCPAQLEATATGWRLHL